MIRTTDRAQTTIDFAIGTSVFLLTVAFVVAFVPGILQPFTTGSQEEVASIDRVSSSLATDLLGDSSTPYILNTTCVEAFFNDTSACGFDGSLSVRQRVGLSDRQRVNVRLVGEDRNDDGSPDVLCTTSDGTVDEETDVATCVTRLEGGRSVPAEGADVIARRAVYLDGRDASLIVRMW